MSDWNEKLQVTLTRSLSVQDGLDEMFDWMQGVEKDLKEHQQVPLNSSSIQEIIAKNNVSKYSDSTLFLGTMICTVELSVSEK